MGCCPHCGGGELCLIPITISDRGLPFNFILIYSHIGFAALQSISRAPVGQPQPQPPSPPAWPPPSITKHSPHYLNLAMSSWRVDKSGVHFRGGVHASIRWVGVSARGRHLTVTSCAGGEVTSHLGATWAVALTSVSL
jgi:hypothetical protein